jgi:hypothetical protein
MYFSVVSVSCSLSPMFFGGPVLTIRVDSRDSRQENLLSAFRVRVKVFESVLAPIRELGSCIGCGASLALLIGTTGGFGWCHRVVSVGMPIRIVPVGAAIGG